MSNDTEQLRLIVEARNALRDMKNMKCTCSGFILQYDGCSCDKGDARKQAKEKLQSLIDGLQVASVDKDVLITNEPAWLTKLKNLTPTEAKMVEETLGKIAEQKRIVFEFEGER